MQVDGSVSALDSGARRTLVERAAATLLDAIRDGRLAPGVGLPHEQHLARQLGVSRTATREALQRLVSLDVIDARHGQGYFVRTPEAARAVRPEVLALSSDPDELRELVEARVGLECDLAALAAKRATPEDLAAMRGALDGMAGAYGAGRLPTEHDIAFMEVAAAGNRFLYRLTDGIRAYLHTMPARLGTWDDDPQVQIGQHRAVYAAIAAGDASAASAATLQHFRLALVQFDQLRARLDPQEGSGEAAS